MAFFNNTKIKTKPFPIPTEPIYHYPDLPEKEYAPDGEYDPLPKPDITSDSTITFYQVTDENEKIDKSLGQGVSFSGSLIEDTDILNPVVVIETSTNLVGYNYAYIDTTNRYYYMHVVCLPDSRFRCIMNVDPLKSFKAAILNCIGTLKKTEDMTHYDLDIYDGDIKVEQGRAIKVSAYHPPDGGTFFLQEPTAILVACGKLSSST